MPALPSGEWKVALVGASTLLGKEVKSVLEEGGVPLRRLELIDSAERGGQLTEFEGEPAILQPVSADVFHGLDLAIFASSPSFTGQHWRAAAEAGCRILDLSYALEREPRARLCAPLVAPLWEAAGERGANGMESCGIAVSAHPAALVMSGILALLSRGFGVRRAAATIFAPVSERGQAGVEELHRQTVGLLSFKELPKAVFDAQVAFNLLPRYGDEARPTLREEQARVRDHLSIVVGGSALHPAVRLIQAPVFHGYSFSMWAELNQPAAPDKMEAALDSKPFSVRHDADAQPDVVAAAGLDEILLGSIESDPASEAGYWIWGAFDNLRIAARNAERIAQQMHRATTGRAPMQPGRLPV